MTADFKNHLDSLCSESEKDNATTVSLVVVWVN